MKPFWNKIYISSLIIVLITVFACNEKKIAYDNSVVKANIVGMSGQQAILQNMNPFHLMQDTVAYDVNGQVVFNIDISKPAYYSLALGKAKIVLYIKPGDSVIISGDASQLMSSIRFGGNAPIYNDYLFRSTKISMIFQNKLMNEFAKEEKIVTNSLDSLRAVHADEMAALQKGNSNLDPYFLKIEKARILYEWAILHRLYPDYYRYIHKGSEFETSPEYETYLAETNIDDGELLDLPLYVSFIETYMKNKYEVFFTDSLEDQYPSYINFQLKEIDKQFKNKDIKSVLAYNTVKQLVTYDGVKDFETYWELFNSLCNNANLLSDMNLQLSEWEHLKKGKPAKDFTFVNIDGDNVSLSDFKGKWIYVDIWATWCNPCMRELPYLLSLEEELANKNIVFMSVSVDKTQEPWIKTVKEKQMKGVQIWSGQNEIITKFYKVSGIPRFMIIDPNGNIYSSSADRPSEGVGKQLIALMD